MSNLNLAIEVLEKELERQNLLIAASETPIYRSELTIGEVYPHMIELRSQLEDAIKILLLKRWEK